MFTAADIVAPIGTTPFSRLMAERKTVLRYYRRTVQKGDRGVESEALIQFWLEKGLTLGQLVEAIDSYENECQAKGREFRRVAHTFFDPENGPIEQYLTDEVAVPAIPNISQRTKTMRDAFRTKEKENGEKSRK